jgi:hypothetical protein
MKSNITKMHGQQNIKKVRNKFHTPGNKMGKIQSAPDYTKLPRVFHAGKRGTIINKREEGPIYFILLQYEN